MLEAQKFLTIEEAATFLHVSETSLRRWTNSGKLPCYRVGGRSERRFLAEDLLAFMRSRTTPSSPPSTEMLSIIHLPALTSLQPNDAHKLHICLFFRSQEEQWRLLCPYLLSYLNANRPVLYLYDSTPSARLMEQLHAEGLPLDGLIARGLLRVLPPDQSYLLTGRFDAQRMLTFIEEAIQSTLAAGHSHVLLTGEMTWCFSKSEIPGVEQLVTYEALLNPLMEKYPTVTLLCQYDLKRFDGASILDALLTHPSVHMASGLIPGFYGL
ncbi:MAG TPA: MEDS domain-containing protein [Ktedonobacteraceae bacterium]|nr:MEDS domain-containing protein [Ktedonobacteraceae bacterium]